MSTRITLLLEDELHAEIIKAAAAMHWSVATYLRTATIERLRRDEVVWPVKRSAPPTPQSAAPAPQATTPDPQPRTPVEAALFAKWDGQT